MKPKVKSLCANLLTNQVFMQIARQADGNHQGPDCLSLR